MKLNYKFAEFEKRISTMQKELKDMKNDLDKVKDNTTKFLNICKNIGIKTVGINTKSDLIESSKSWNYGNGNMFSDERSDAGWPLIWKAVSDYDAQSNEDRISGGAGNEGQYQINRNALLMDGIYQLEKGKWIKKD